MEDGKIVDLYWARDHRAISESEAKYGSYCHLIAQNIVDSPEDAAECVNDTWLGAWNAMPPHRPGVLGAFLGKITRRISLDRLRRRHAAKRGGGQVEVVLEELSACVSGRESPESEVLHREQVRVINDFLFGLEETERNVFLRRYWYMDSIEKISARFGFSQSKVTSMLFRTRQKLRKRLEREDML